MKTAKVELLVDELIAKLELTQNNLEPKLQELQSYILKKQDFKNFYSLNSDLEKILIQLEGFLNQDFSNLIKIITARFAQTNSNLNFTDQIQAWLTKDFINADKLFQREFEQIVSKQKYSQLKQEFLFKLIFTKAKNHAQEELNYEFNLEKQLELIQNFNENFYLTPTHKGKEVLQAKYKILLEHTQVNPEQVFYLSLCANSSPKRQSTFADFAVSSLKRQIYHKAFFKTFKLQMQSFSNLPVLIFKDSGSFFALDSKLCLYVIEKLIADFLFLYKIDYEKFCVFSKPEKYPNFYIKSTHISILINSEFEFYLQNHSKNKLVKLNKNTSKTQAYQLLEEALIYLDRSYKNLTPLSPDELWNKTSKLLEDIFIGEATQILTLLWYENISLEKLDANINKNLAKIYSSNSLVFLLRNAYAQILQKYAQDFKKNEQINQLDFNFSKESDNFILINSGFNSSFNTKKSLAKIGVNNRVFALDYSSFSASLFTSLYAQYEQQESNLEFLPSNSLLEFFALEAIELKKNQLETCKNYFFAAKLAQVINLILAKNLKDKSRKIGIFVANKMQKNLLKKDLKKILTQENLKKLKFFYTYSNLSEAKFKKLNYALLIDLYFCTRFLSINDKYISMILPNLNNEILKSAKDFYKLFLSLELNLKKAIVFSHKHHTDLLIS